MLRPAHTALILTVLAASPLGGQEDLRRVFEQARILQEKNTNLAESVRLYDLVAERGKGQRSLAAQALYQSGLVHVRLGRRDEAARRWRRVITEFPEQHDIVRLARRRLNPVGTQINGVTARRVMDAVDFPRPSPDGRYIAFMEGNSGNLALRDLATGEARTLTNKPPGWKTIEQANGAVFSPSGSEIAYVWMTQSSYELRAITIRDRRDRLIHKCVDSGFCAPVDWSRDGKRLLVVYERKDRLKRLGVVDLSGEARLIPLRSPLWGAAAFTPDGQAVVATVAQDDERSGDIAHIAFDGTETTLLRHPANEYVVGWTPAGRLLFASDRRGTMSLWTLAVRNGAAAGEPVVVHHGLDDFTPLGLTRSGNLYYRLGGSLIDVYTAEVDLSTATLLSPPKPVPQQFLGTNQYPSWSPDGRTLMFHSNGRGSANRIVLLTLADRSARDVAPVLRRFVRPEWSPDGRSAFMFGTDTRDTEGHFYIDLNTGAATLAFSKQETDSRFEGAWGPGGRSYFNRPSAWKLGIYRLESSTRTRQTIYVPPADTSIGQVNLAASPDGRWLAFNASTPSGNELRVLPAEGGEPRVLLTLAPPEHFPLMALTWTPDSKTILAARGSNERNAVWAVPLDGSPPRRLPVEMDGLKVLRLNPDGRTLAFQGGVRAGEIWVLENFLQGERGVR